MTYPCLNSKWALVIQNQRAYVVRRKDLVRVATLSALEAIALRLMNGRRTSDVVKEVMFEIGGKEGITAFKQVHTRLKALLSQGASTSHQESLTELALVEDPEPTNGIRSLPGPRVLHWWVTDICPRRCVYCFASPKYGSQAHDASLCRKTLMKIFSESASLGATELLISGGEPFLRNDLPEVMGDAINKGLNPNITTKFPLNSELTSRLSASGLKHICLSIDSFSSSENALLIGSRNYATQVRNSVRNLVKENLAFSFECVVTRLNVNSLKKVIAEAQNLGAKMVHVVPYEPVLYPIGQFQNNDLSLPPDYPLDENIEIFSEKYPNVRIIKFEKLDKNEQCTYHCDIGMTKLFFTCNGRIHRCYKLLRDPDLLGADLNKITVAEAWHDPNFLKMASASRAAYSDSACGNCDRFSNCNESGRCIYESYANYQTYYSKDRKCNGPYSMQNSRSHDIAT